MNKNVYVLEIRLYVRFFFLPLKKQNKIRSWKTLKFLEHIRGFEVSCDKDITGPIFTKLVNGWMMYTCDFNGLHMLKC